MVAVDGIDAIMFGNHSPALAKILADAELADALVVSSVAACDRDGIEEMIALRWNSYLAPGGVRPMPTRLELTRSVLRDYAAGRLVVDPDGTARYRTGDDRPAALGASSSFGPLIDEAHQPPPDQALRDLGRGILEAFDPLLQRIVGVLARLQR